MNHYNLKVVLSHQIISKHLNRLRAKLKILIYMINQIKQIAQIMKIKRIKKYQL